MFTYLYTFIFYRFIKSGMLLDFFFKKYVYIILYFLFFICNIYFSEKYFIEYNFLRVNRLFNYVRLFIDYFNSKFIVNALTITIGFTILVLLLIL